VFCPAKQNASTKWLTVVPPYIPDTVVPAPHLGFVQVKVYNLSRLAKRLGGWVRHAVWQEWSCTGIRKKKQGPLNMQVT
jgi:hypothetical protein